MADTGRGRQGNYTSPRRIGRMTLNAFIAVTPSIVGVLYMATAIAYWIKGDFSYGLMWASYTLANVALVVIGLRN